jgi:hypothetical protein
MTYYNLENVVEKRSDDCRSTAKDASSRLSSGQLIGAFAFPESLGENE